MVQIWGLTDHRIGTANQVRGVARHTRFTVAEIALEYTGWADLPNFATFGNGLRGVQKQIRSSFHSPWPDVVIAAGRRTAPVALWIKSQHPSVKLVQIMHPDMALRAFDLVVLPTHDLPEVKPNILTTLGAPHALNDEMLFAARARLPLNVDRFPKPWTMVCVGGNSPSGKFTLHDAEQLVSSLAPVAGEGSLLVTGSRRTPPAIMHHTIEQIRATYPFVTLDVHMPEQQEENPYHAWLAQADRIVVTADSVSMVSEAAYTSKPVYVFMPSTAASPKHRHFIDDMIEASYIRQLETYDPLWRGSVRLDEAQKVARVIRGWFGK
jgi:uncharacterized protein